MDRSKRIKVLFVLNHFEFSNGVASTLRSLIDNIDQERFEVHVLPLYNLDKKFVETVKGKFILHKGIGFYFRGLGKMINIFPLKLLYRLFVREEFDVEVAYQFGTPTRIISVSHNLNKICWMHTYDEKMELRSFYKMFNRIISVAKVGQKKLVKDGFLNSDYCYNIIDEQNIHHLSEKNSDLTHDEEITLMTVCRVDPDKACLRLVQCLKEIKEKFPNFKFILIGDGRELPDIREFVKRNNMESYIQLMGAQSNPFKYLKHADVYFNGALREGFSTACQEAAILGIPVVTTEVDGAQELIELTGCGRVVPNSEEGIKNVLYDIFENPSILESWKLIAEQNKSKLYKLERIKKIERTLCSVVKK